MVHINRKIISIGIISYLFSWNLKGYDICSFTSLIIMLPCNSELTKHHLIVISLAGIERFLKQSTWSWRSLFHFCNMSSTHEECMSQLIYTINQSRVHTMTDMFSWIGVNILSLHGNLCDFRTEFLLFDKLQYSNATLVHVWNLFKAYSVEKVVTDGTWSQISVLCFYHQSMIYTLSAYTA